VAADKEVLQFEFFDHPKNVVGKFFDRKVETGRHVAALPAEFYHDYRQISWQLGDKRSERLQIAPGARHQHQHRPLAWPLVAVHPFAVW
jgi:hypothetical protein